MIDTIVPVYNEGKNIQAFLDEMANSVRTPFKVILIYDFDEDDTLPVIRQIRSNYPFDICLEKNLYERGVLNALKTGFLKSTADIILVTHADLCDSLSVVDPMYQKINEDYDLVCGSRYLKGCKVKGGPLLKKTLSRLAGVSLHWLSGIPTHDATNCFKMFRREIINNIEIESTGGFEIGLELTVKSYRMGYKITEVASNWQERVHGKSNFRVWPWLHKYLKWYFLGVGARRRRMVILEDRESLQQ